MSSQSWQAYLLPHRFTAAPAWVRLLMACASGAILSLAFRGSFPSIYSWFCMALLLSSILGASGRVAFACGYLHAIFFVATCVPWIAETLSIHGGMSAAAGWGVLFLIASVWGGAIGLFALAVRRIAQRSVSLALFAVPFLWMATEVFRAYLPEISFPWALLGYPAAENPAIVQLTTITGIYGVSFLVAAFNALLLWIDAGIWLNFKKRFAIFAAVFTALVFVEFVGPRWVPVASA